MPQDLVSRLRAARAHIGLTQSEVAERINKTKASVSGYENGLAKPDPEDMVAVFRGTDIDVLWLLTGEGEMLRPRVRVSPEAPPSTPAGASVPDAPVLYYVTDDAGRRYGRILPARFEAIDTPPEISARELAGYLIGH